ncbi:MAG TPA: CHRD domain-containing protein [Geminicoccaceae bacterium]|nr:CHRD domain-containing protein [Geminicoccaceae bacterium]
MRRIIGCAVLGGAALAVGLGVPTSANAQDFEATLRGFKEVPAVSTRAKGTFDATISQDQIEYELTYDKLQGQVQQAHIHFGQRAVNGGISAFLCSNLGNGPVGTQTCPESPGSVTGVIRPTDVIGPAAQGIAPGEFRELERAIRDGVAYANVHTDLFPAGEIRGQIKPVKVKPASAEASN